MQYPASELVLDKNGQVYHLGLHPKDLAPIVLLVGDQDRVSMISAFFDTIEHTSQHREFVCHTGMFQGKRISALSTGIGTDNIDIVVNELDALVNIDLENRKDQSLLKSLTLVRIGTCGILQPNIPVHSYVLSTHAIGLDNIAHFYPISFTEEEKQLVSEVENQLDLPSKIMPYVVTADQNLVAQFSGEKTHNGITITSSGFYAPQGRTLRLGVNKPHLNEQISAFNAQGHRIVNFEMESSALFALGKGLGHRCVTICLGVANRPNMEFSTGYTAEMEELIKYVLERC
jgi:uridine phosphorylase